MANDQTREIEILETGTHNGVPFTEADLDEMVANYTTLAAHIKPPLKLGHDDAQILHGQADGDPALGWVAGLRREGSKLLAMVADVPQRLAELIAKRRYRRVSSEVTLAFDQTGWEQNLQSGVTGKVLTGLALLGADLPAVTTLNDLATLLATDTGLPMVIDGPDVTPVTFVAVCTTPDAKAHVPIPRKEGRMAEERTLETMQAELDALTASLHARDQRDVAVGTEHAALTAEVARLRTENEHATQRAELAAKQQTALEADAYVESMSRADCLKLTTPEAKAHVRALYVKLAASGPAIDADESVVLKLSATPRAMTALDVLKGLVGALPDQKAMLTVMARPQSGTVHADDVLEETLQGIAKAHALNLSVPKDRAKAITLFAASSPKDRDWARNAGVLRAAE